VRLLTYEEAALFLGVSRRTIYNMVARGEIPVVRLSNRICRIDRHDLELLVEAAKAIDS
jgi:excisionase family DNA binding protein